MSALWQLEKFDYLMQYNIIHESSGFTELLLCYLDEILAHHGGVVIPILNKSWKSFVLFDIMDFHNSPNLPYSKRIGSLAVAIPVLKVVKRENA